MVTLSKPNPWCVAEEKEEPRGETHLKMRQKGMSDFLIVNLSVKLPKLSKTLQSDRHLVLVASRLYILTAFIIKGAATLSQCPSNPYLARNRKNVLYSKFGEITEIVGKQKIKYTPELFHMVLKRSARESDAMLRLKTENGLCGE